MRRASVMAQRNSPLRLRFAEGEVTVSAQTQDVGEAKESLPVPFSGEPLEIGFNPEFLRDGLESVDTRRDRAAADQPAPAGPPPLRGRELLVPDHADPPSGLIVENVTLRDYRSYASLELELRPGLVLAVGGNGAGKTNLLEALHVGTQGFSPRSRNDAQLVRFGTEAARIELAGDSRRLAARDRGHASPRRREEGSAERRDRCARPSSCAPRSRRSSSRRTGSSSSRAGLLRGGRTSTALWAGSFRLGRACRRSTAPPWRNGTLRCGGSRSARRRETPSRRGRSASPSSARSARRGSAGGDRAPRALRSRERAAELGLPGGELRYEAEPPTAEALEARLDDDLDRGTTGLGPHLDDVEIRADDRDLRRFGSQGEQRLAVLSLILAEAALLAERGPAPPLLLLDDVLSELDERRRAALAERLAGPGQTLITATAAQPCPSSRRSSSRSRPERREHEARADRRATFSRELARFGPAEGMTEIVRAWPGAVGDQIARNAWPARLARDGTLHVATSSSAWAFELAQLEPKLLERLREALGETRAGGAAIRAG